MQTRTDKIAVLGGGLTGLTVAHELAMSGHRVEVIDAAPVLGGQAAGFDWNGHAADRYYQCQLPSDHDLLQLIDETGLNDRMDWQPASFGFVSGQRYGLNGLIDLLRFKPLSWSEKLRLGLLSVATGILGQGQNLEAIRAEDWLTRLCGQGLYRKFMKPLVVARFGACGPDLPASYVMAGLNRASSSSSRGYLRGGMKTLVSALEERLRQYDVEIRTGCMIESIEDTGSGVEINLTNGRQIRAGWAVSTLPLPIFRRAIAGTSLEEKLDLPTLRYQGTVSATFFLRQNLDTNLWAPVSDFRAEFDAIAQVSKLADRGQFGGYQAVCAMKTCDRYCTLFQESPELIAERWKRQFVSLYWDLGLREEHIADVRVVKTPYVEPVYPLGYSTQVPAIHDGETHIFLATAAQVYPKPASWNSSVWLARQTVRELRHQMRLVEAVDKAPAKVKAQAPVSQTTAIAARAEAA